MDRKRVWWALCFVTLDTSLMNLRLAFEFQHLEKFYVFKFEPHARISLEHRVSTLWTWTHVLRLASEPQRLVCFLLCQNLNFVLFFFTLRYSLNPLSKRQHFGHIGGPDANVIFSLWKTTPAFTGTNEERQARLTKGSALTLREPISDRNFESDSWRLVRKPEFLFRDALKEDAENMYDGNYKWLCQIRNQRFFLSNIKWMFPLPCLQSISLRRYMDWYLVKTQAGVSIEGSPTMQLFPSAIVERFLNCSQAQWSRSSRQAKLLNKLEPSWAGLWRWRGNSLKSDFWGPGWVHSSKTTCATFPVSHGRKILELLTGLMKQEFSTSETPKQVGTFLSRFMEVKGEFPKVWLLRARMGAFVEDHLVGEDGRLRPQS